MSTNKVYGDAPERAAARRARDPLGLRRPGRRDGIAEDCRIDACLHSLFGASKVAADVMVQEYGRYFGMPTVCYPRRLPHRPEPLRRRAARLPRLPGPLRASEGRTYRVYGYKGKQVRDNIHSYDVCTAFLAFYERPASARCTTSAAAARTACRSWRRSPGFEELIGKKLDVEYVDQNRVGDHICYISDLRRLRADYPGWRLTRSLDDIFASWPACLDAMRLSVVIPAQNEPAT